MPPTPEPSQASALASAGIERVPPTSAAMSLSATAVIQAAPNAIIIVNSATEATTQDARLSIEVDCNINERPGWRSPIAGRR
jgi:ABC-type hemin transport system substrate-binding protein